MSSTIIFCGIAAVILLPLADHQEEPIKDLRTLVVKVIAAACTFGTFCLIGWTLGNLL